MERAKYCEYGDFEDQACRDRFIAGLVDETLQRKLNPNDQRDKEGNIVEFRAVVEIAKNYESSTDARRLMMQVRGDREQVNWTAKVPPSKTKSPQPPSGSHSKGLPPKQSDCKYSAKRKVSCNSSKVYLHEMWQRRACGPKIFEQASTCECIG